MSGEGAVQGGWSVSADFAAIPHARHAVASWLGEQGASVSTTDDVLLVLSELLTNAVRASLTAGTDVRLTVTKGEEGFRLTVADRGPGFTPRQSSGDSLPDGGRGFTAVRAVAAELDIGRRPNGWTVVSAVVPRSGEAAQRPQGMASGTGAADRRAKRITRPGSALSAL
jgi:anti-sigma regulatory factor (Ser/Thr protein kinase)